MIYREPFDKNVADKKASFLFNLFNNPNYKFSYGSVFMQSNELHWHTEQQQSNQHCLLIQYHILVHS